MEVIILLTLVEEAIGTIFQILIPKVNHGRRCEWGSLTFCFISVSNDGLFDCSLVSYEMIDIYNNSWKEMFDEGKEIDPELD